MPIGYPYTSSSSTTPIPELLRLISKKSAHEIATFLVNGQKIYAIKKVREITGSDLRTAKNFADYYESNPSKILHDCERAYPSKLDEVLNVNFGKGGK